MIAGLTVRAPATVANVGPGFDVLAFALDWTNEITVEPAPSLAIEVEGFGAESIPRDASNLVVRAMERVLGAVPRAHIRLRNRVPFGRGFGSSAAAIVGGITAAAAMSGDARSAGDHFNSAIEMEGHADNVTACFLGGFTVSLPHTLPARLDPPKEWRALVAVAPGPLETHAARKALPPAVPFADAALTAGRTARLVAAIATGDTDALLAATDDCLHQPARFVLAPETGAIVRALREHGIAAFLSGAGPSVAALVHNSDAERAREVAVRSVPKGWEVHTPGFALQGADVVVSDEPRT